MKLLLLVIPGMLFCSSAMAQADPNGVGAFYGADNKTVVRTGVNTPLPTTNGGKQPALTTPGAYEPPNVDANGSVITKTQLTAGAASVAVCPIATKTLVAEQISSTVTIGLGLLGETVTGSVLAIGAGTPDYVVSASNPYALPVPHSNVITASASSNGIVTCVQDFAE